MTSTSNYLDILFILNHCKENVGILIKFFPSEKVFSVGHLTLVGWSPMKSLLSVCLSVCPSSSPSLIFLKIGSLVFSDIVHDDSSP